MNIWNWIWQNKEWLFSGLGVILLTNIGSFIWGKKTGITIAGNKFINNYNYYNEKTKIDYTAGVQLATGASGIEWYCCRCFNTHSSKPIYLLILLAILFITKVYAINMVGNIVLQQYNEY